MLLPVLVFVFKLSLASVRGLGPLSCSGFPLVLLHYRETSIESSWSCWDCLGDPLAMRLRCFSKSPNNRMVFQNIFFGGGSYRVDRLIHGCGTGNTMGEFVCVGGCCESAGPHIERYPVLVSGLFARILQFCLLVGDARPEA